MPQGAPQQQPRMAQGMMSQARPVQLAGGGIVAFQEGMRVNAPEKAGFFSQFSLPDMDAVRRAEERRKAERARAIAAGGDYPEDITLDEAVEAINELAEKPLPYTYKARQEAERAAKAKADEGFEFSEEGLAALDEAMRPGKARPKVVPPAGASTTAGGIASAGGGEQPSTLREKQLEALQAIQTGIGNIEPYEMSEKLSGALESQLGRNPAAEGEAAIKRVQELAGLEAAKTALDAQKERARKTFEESAPSRMDNLIDLFTAAGRGGITGVGVRGGQLRREETKRREAFDENLREIENKAIDLQSTVGTAAANNYEKAAKTAQDTINTATSTLQRANAEGNRDYLARVQLKMTSDKSMADYLGALSEDERAAANRVLEGERITSANARGELDATSRAITSAAERKRKIEENVRERYTLAIQLAENDPTKLAEIERTIAEQILDETAEEVAFIKNAETRLMEASDALKTQRGRLETVELDPQQSAALSKAGV
tara:strand:- start:1016 stop:2491 length:1476 start_codon:yes stop_codon:yes gene_type:complete